MNHRMTIAQICGAVESPLFDRKSARIDAKTLAIHLIAFANADGGMIAVGVEDDGTITGIDGHSEHINELLRAPFDFCKPSVRVETERLSCVNRDGTPDHILLIEVLQSNDLHANQADEVFFRVGDKSKKLNFEERLQLMYAKGTRYFEDTPVPDAAMEDIDIGFVKAYTEKLGYRKSPEEYLRENKEFVSEKGGKEAVSAAAMLLFGRNPKRFFPRARIRTYTAIQQWFEDRHLRPHYACIFDERLTDCYAWGLTKNGYFVFGGAFTPRHARRRFEELKLAMRGRGFPLERPIRTEACAVLRPAGPADICCGGEEVFLVGEAAGLVSPSSLEGMSYAFESAGELYAVFNARLSEPGRAYCRKIQPLRFRLLAKIAKCPFIFSPPLRRLVMAGGIGSLPEGY